MNESKREIRARIDELKKIYPEISDGSLSVQVLRRLAELERMSESAEEDMSVSIINSHKALCKAKNMGENEAYGHDPALYYALGICAEAGELANNIVKAMRWGSNARERYIPAIVSELPDVIIYSHILAYTHDIDLPKLVSEKSAIVVERAASGYYGGVIHPVK